MAVKLSRNLSASKYSVLRGLGGSLVDRSCRWKNLVGRRHAEYSPMPAYRWTL